MQLFMMLSFSENLGRNSCEGISVGFLEPHKGCLGGSRFRATVASGLVDSIIMDGSGGLLALGYLPKGF